MSRNGSYHINHSNKVVHLKWGMKRSLILPRSSCFKTETCGHVGAGCWAPPLPWLRGGFPVGCTLRPQEPRTQTPSPVWPNWPPEPGPSNFRRLDSEGLRCSEPPTPTWNPEAGSRPLGLGPPDTFQVISWARGAENPLRGCPTISRLAPR